MKNALTLLLACLWAGLIHSCDSRTLKNAAPRMIEDCVDTRMAVQEEQRFVGGAVYRSVKLEPGEGTLACLALCKADEDCWTFNFKITRRLCFLMTTASDEASSRSSVAYNSGYRECVEGDVLFDNDPVDFGDPEGAPYAAANVAGAAGPGAAVALTWDNAPVAKTTTVAYTALCVAQGASCYATKKGVAVKKLPEGAGSTPHAIVGLDPDTAYTCYVQTFIGGTSFGCSAGVTVTTPAA